MEVVALVIAVIAAASAGTTGFLYARKTREAEAHRLEMDSKLTKAEERRKKAERKVEDMTKRVRRTEEELAEAIARRDEKNMALAMWNLELERAERQWRDVVLPGTEDEDGGGTTGERLAAAISGDVDRLREEVGVSIRFAGALSLDMEPETALGALRISEEILAAVAKHADDVTVTLDEGSEPSVSITFGCEGWTDNSGLEHSDLGANIGDMAHRLDGWVRYERQAEDGLTISLQLPAASSVTNAPEREPQPQS